MDGDEAADGSGHWLDWAPVGYRPAMIGVVLFAIGGAGDAIWHSIFGVETSTVVAFMLTYAWAPSLTRLRPR